MILDLGEEGLDVGEVDLIICFDISQHSPTRLVQRMGRTGRKRDGHIIILVTDGREYEVATHFCRSETYRGRTERILLYDHNMSLIQILMY